MVEINPEWSVYGVGILQPANVLRALDVLGLADACVRQGFAFGGIRIFDEDGSQLLDESFYDRLVTRLPAMNGITRPRLHQILTTAALAAGTDVRLGVTVQSISQSGSSVEVVFSDGRSGRYDLLLGADGIYSQVRRMVFGSEVVPSYTGQIVWRVNVPRPPEIDELTLFLLDGGAAGKAGLVPTAPDLAYLFTADAWSEERLPLHREGLDAMLRERLKAYGGIVGELRDRYVTDSDEVIVRPQESILVPAPWYRGRVLLIGDAAHAPTSKLGQGAAQAIEDAIVIAQELVAKATIDEALSAFMQRRFERCRFVVEGSLQIGRWELGLDRDSIDHAGMTRRSMEVTAAPI